MVLILACAVLASACNRPRVAPADTLITNARIYTMNAKEPWAQAMAVRGGNIVAVGSDKAIAEYQGPSTDIIDAKGRIALPGLVDAHVHLMAGAAQLEQIALNDAKTLDDFQRLITDSAAAPPEQRWIQGMGWYYSVFGHGGQPDKKYLDAVVSARPVYLAAYDGHSSLANSKALEAAGITRRTPDPPSGTVVRDPATGEPTGFLKEAAGSLVAKAIPTVTREKERDRLARAIHYASSIGFTRLISAGADAERVELFDQIRQRGELTLRLYMARFVTLPLSPEFIRLLEENRKKYSDEWIDLGTVKFLLDGVIEAHTAAMLEPYSNAPGSRGLLYFDPEEYRRAVVRLHSLGFPISTHAIGDRAIRLALDSYEAAYKANGGADARDRIEHIENPGAEDIARFGRLGVVASMQPLHATPNDNLLGVWAANVGPVRAQRGWPWRDILAGGAGRRCGSAGACRLPDVPSVPICAMSRTRRWSVPAFSMRTRAFTTCLDTSYRRRSTRLFSSKSTAS